MTSTFKITKRSPERRFKGVSHLRFIFLRYEAQTLKWESNGRISLALKYTSYYGKL